MVGGQLLDLAAEGRFADAARPGNEDEVATLQAMKTGALIRTACVAGGILGEVRDNEIAALDRYGAAVGQAFQIADDLLDIEGDASTLGKSTQKDEAAGKATMAGILGVEKAKDRLAQLVTDANAALAPFGGKADMLKAAACFVAERRA